MKLSICIPTRNRADTISVTLDSIISQENKNIEIIIVDGASTDNTQMIIKKYKKRFKNITYYRREKCVGVDKDISKAIQLANNPYCWLLSDDDALITGSIPYIIQHLKEHSKISGISTNYVHYNDTLDYPVDTMPASNGNKLNCNTYFTSAEDCFFDIGIHLGFLSCQIVRKDLWEKVLIKNDLSIFENNWMMVYIIGRMIMQNPSWHYIHRQCVRQRIDNDSFVNKVGIYNRQLITHVDYGVTIAGLFGRKSKVYNSIFYHLVSDRLPRNFANLKSKNISFSMQIKLFKLYFITYNRYIAFWLKVAPLFFIPNFIYIYIRKIYFYKKKQSYHINKL